MKRFLLSCAAVVSAALLAELLYRWLGPEPYARPVIRDSNGTVVDLGDIIGFFRAPDSNEDPVDAPANGIKPGFRGWLCYDRPALDYFDAEGCVEVRINRFGFRDEEFELEPEPDELRMLAIGDSFTFGQGVRAEDTWPELLEERLAEVHDGPVQVMNAGFTGGGSWPQEYRSWVEEHALAFGPEVVVYGMCLNDIDRRVPMLAWVKVWDDPNTWGDPWLGGKSAILNRIQHARQERRFIENRPRDLTAIIRTDPGPWEANQEALRGIAAFLEANGVRFVIAVFPMLSLLGDGYPYRGLHETVASFCTEEEIEHLDLYDRFHGLDDRELWIHPMDQHPNPVAQRIFAEGIFERLGR